MGVNQYSRQWSRIKTYGGKIFENITRMQRAMCSPTTCRRLKIGARSCTRSRMTKALRA